MRAQCGKWSFRRRLKHGRRRLYSHRQQWLADFENLAAIPSSFALNRDVTLLAEKYGFEFALSMIKLRGFGGESEFWDHALESFTLMAGIAAVTQRIKLYASSAVLTLPPAIAARMASTIDSIAPGRFGINIVSGWAEAEYSQMGLWPGKEHYERRYEYSAEYVTVMRELWEKGTSDHKGAYFQMTDCKLSPRPSVMPTIVSAGQSDVGMAFAAEHADFNFCLGEGVNTPTKCAAYDRAPVEGRREDRPERRRLRPVHGDRGRNRCRGAGEMGSLQSRQGP